MSRWNNKWIVVFFLYILTGTSIFAASINVNKFSGALEVSSCDLEIQGCPTPIKLVRQYNSNRLIPSGLFGNGWTTNLDISLVPGKKGNFFITGPFTKVEKLIPSTDKSVWLSVKGKLIRKKEFFTYIDDNNLYIYIFDLTGKIKYIMDAFGNYSRFKYGPRKRLTAVYNKQGQWLQFKYDSRGRINVAGVSTGEIKRYYYNKNNTLKTILGDGTAHKYKYIKPCLLRELSLGSMSWIFDYDKQKRITSVKNPYGTDSYTRFEDSRGSVTITRRPGGIKNLQVCYKDKSGYMEIENGTKTIYKRNKKGRLASINGPDGITTFQWNSNGTLASKTEPGNKTTQYFYRSKCNTPIKIVRPDGKEETFRCNKGGQIYQTVVDGILSEMKYDKQGRISSRKSGQNLTEYHYDGTNPWLASKIIFNGKVIAESEFDKKGKLVSVTTNGKKAMVDNLQVEMNRKAYKAKLNPWKLISSKDGLIKYTKDKEGNIFSVKYPEGLCKFYNYSCGDLVQEFIDKGKSKAYKYNKYGLEVSRENVRKQKTKLIYDLENNLSSISFPEKITYGYSYKNNKITDITKDYRTIRQFEYYPDGLLKSETFEQKKVHYLPGGQGVSVDKFELKWCAGKDGGLAAIVTGQYDAIEFYSKGNTSFIRFPNGVVSSREVDPKTMTVKREVRNGRELMFSEICIYNNSGQITKRVVNGKTVKYEYDPKGQLIQSQPENQYSYNSWGSRVSGLLNSVEVSYKHNKFGGITESSKPPLSFDYDADGNMTEIKANGKTVGKLNFNSRNQLTLMSIGPRVMKFDYRPDGMLAKMTMGNEATRFVYAGLNPLADYKKDETRYYISGPGLNDIYGVKIVTPKGEEKYYYHKDELGNIVLVTGDRGGIYGSCQYSPYGIDISSSSSNKCDFGFQGARRIPEANLYYMGARFYFPHLGAFISKDPVGGYLEKTLSTNPYIFAMNDPVNNGDPLGRQATQKSNWNQSHMSSTAEGCLFDSIASTATTLAGKQGHTIVSFENGKKALVKGSESTLNYLRKKGITHTQPLTTLARAEKASNMLGYAYDAGKLMLSAAEISAKVKAGQMTAKEGGDAMKAEVAGAGMGRLAGWGASVAKTGFGGGLMVGVAANIAADQYKEAYRQSGKVEDAALNKEDRKLKTDSNNWALYQQRLENIKRMMNSSDPKTLRQADAEISGLQSFAMGQGNIPSNQLDYLDRLEEQVGNKIDTINNKKPPKSQSPQVAKNDNQTGKSSKNGDRGKSKPPAIKKKDTDGSDSNDKPKVIADTPSPPVKPQYSFRRPDYNPNSVRDSINNDKRKKERWEKKKVEQNVSNDVANYWAEEARKKRESEEFWNGLGESLSAGIQGAASGMGSGSTNRNPGYSRSARPRSSSKKKNSEETPKWLEAHIAGARYNSSSDKSKSSSNSSGNNDSGVKYRMGNWGPGY